MVEKYNPKYVPIPRGLNNIGNTCYFNSLVQALLSCPSVVHAVSTKSNDPLAAALYKMAGGQSADVRELLTIIINNHRGKSNTLHYGWQEDANEGLMMLTEDIKGLDSVFNVRYKTQLDCKCGHSSSVDAHHKEPPEIFVDMYMPPPNKNPYEYFSKYLRVYSDVPEDYKCDKCRQIGTTMKSKILCRISSVLIVTFKKYTNKNLIDYPPKFTITTNTGPVVYKVVAQIEHYGGMGGGHYVARGLRSDGATYTFNDGSVSNSKLEPTPHTYMVFYHAFQ